MCVCVQCKRKFERDCKEADRAQQYFEKMDADINVTKADVEKVRSAVCVFADLMKNNYVETKKKKKRSNL